MLPFEKNSNDLRLVTWCASTRTDKQTFVLNSTLKCLIFVLKSRTNRGLRVAELFLPMYAAASARVPRCCLVMSSIQGYSMSLHLRILWLFKHGNALYNCFWRPTLLQRLRDLPGLLLKNMVLDWSDSYIQCSEASRLDGHCSVLEVELRTELGHARERGMNEHLEGQAFGWTVLRFFKPCYLTMLLTRSRTLRDELASSSNVHDDLQQDPPAYFFNTAGVSTSHVW